MKRPKMMKIDLKKNEREKKNDADEKVWLYIYYVQKKISLKTSSNDVCTYEF